jgi:hypothetical protein
MCVQRFDDSLNSAIHITYRISLRSSSMPEPRDPLLKVLFDLFELRRSDAGLEGLRGRSPRPHGRVAPEATSCVHKGWRFEARCFETRATNNSRGPDPPEVPSASSFAAGTLAL